MRVEFVINKKLVAVEAEPEERLIDVIREKLHLSGVKEACGEGKCGSCSILFNNKVMLACIIPMSKAGGAEIVTIEGLSDDPKATYVQRAFVEADAIQCGFCTPGLITTIFDYIEGGGKNEREEIKKALSGNLCRCTGYSKVIEAVELAYKYKYDDTQD